MLDFVKRTFRGFFEVLLWLNLIFCVIYVAAFWQRLSLPGGWLVGIIAGAIAGLLTNIVFGGLIATFLELGEDVAHLKRRLNESNIGFGSSTNASSHDNARNRDPISINPALFGPPPSMYVGTGASQAKEPQVSVFPEKPAVPKGRDTSGEHDVFKVQIGLFKDSAKAQAHIIRLRSAGFNPMLELIHSPQHGEVSRVSIPGIRAAERQAVARRLANAGFKGTWVRG